MVTCEEPPGERVTLGHLHDIPTRVDHRMLEGGVGYLAFNIWMLPMVKRVEDAMADLRKAGMTALVLDLRGNPGGVGAMSVPVARLLLTEGGSLGKLQFRDFAQEFNVEPNPQAFTGKVAILVDEGTASTSEIFAAGLRDLGRAAVIGGGPSAGAALPSVIEEIPGGGVLQYVVGDYRSPRGTVVEGVGVLPDVTVPETREDFAAGRDRVLEAAIRHVTGGDRENEP
jgi:carboxyl-terminal processing protease